MKTTEALVDDILRRAGGFRLTEGGAANHGVSAAALGIWRGLHRHATVAEVQALSEAEARRYYRQRVVEASPFAGVQHEPLRVQLMAIGFEHGSAAAVRCLQEALGQRPGDGVLTPQLLASVNAQPGALASNALLAAWLRMLGRLDERLEGFFADPA